MHGSYATKNVPCQAALAGDSYFCRGWRETIDINTKGVSSWVQAAQMMLRLSWGVDVLLRVEVGSWVCGWNLTAAVAGGEMRLR